MAEYPYFRIKSSGKKNMKIKYMGCVGDETYVVDEVYCPVKLSPQFDIYGRDTIYIKPIDGFDIFGKLNWCNISGDHLIKEKRYPYIYLTIFYNKKIIFGELIKIYLSVEIDKSNITNNTQYNNLVITGNSSNWIEHCECDETKYEKQYNYTGKDDAIKYLLDMCETEDFIILIKNLLKQREIERKKKLNLEKVEYVVPQKVVCLNNILDLLKDLGEI